jgi:hypothetical protein
MHDTRFRTATPLKSAWNISSAGINLLPACRKMLFFEVLTAGRALMELYCFWLHTSEKAR